MGNEQYGDAPVPDLAHDPEKILNLIGIQRRCRLIQDQDLGIDDHGPGDGHQLLHGYGYLIERCVRIQIRQAHLGQKAFGRLMGLAPVDAQVPPHLVPEHDVFAHAQIGAQVDFLVDRGDAGVLRIGCAVENPVLAVDGDGSRVDFVYPGERLDHGRFACAVLPHEGMDLTGEQTQIDIVERLDTREFNADSLHGDQGCFFCHCLASSN